MSAIIDLHTHSTCSDGSMSPEELVSHAKTEGLRALALTDHDTVDGLARAQEAAKALDLEFIPGIEFSVVSQRETHIVGLYIDPQEPGFAAALEGIRQERLHRNLMTQERLAALGFPISLEEVRAESHGPLIGRAHFAKVMVKKGFAPSVKEAFRLYLAAGKPAYCPVKALNAQECIRIIKAAGGVAVAAHLHHIGKEGKDLEDYLLELKGYGLDAVEGLYSEYSPEMTQQYQALAKKLGLLLSGGSDFHGSMKPHIAIGKGMGDLAVPYSFLEELKARASTKR